MQKLRLWIGVQWLRRARRHPGRDFLLPPWEWKIQRARTHAWMISGTARWATPWFEKEGCALRSWWFIGRRTPDASQ